MTSRDFDPLGIDVTAFAKAGGELGGRWPVEQLERLAACVEAGAREAMAGDVAWQARGELRTLRGAENQVWLHLSASTRLPLECQRCLRPVETALEVNRDFLFVHGEDAAAQLDTDSDDDVLALTRSLDLRELIEDELLLALPLVPRHEVCPEPLRAPVDDEPLEEKPNPFAALAGLKRPGPLN